MLNPIITKILSETTKTIKEIVEAGKEWFLECDEDEETVDELTDSQVIRLINKNFHGGLAEFIVCMA